ncbi:cytochrome c-type biogenesis protein [Chthonobacter rhizosphaerae]|uniref:cytochrome c-type biogenesis protein n=1 Tax=Chthonobacter rhizosphaerae TaxID=2735553 RepID=UPI0015EF9C9C|nr:cytochrome c-type biogenesis protein [Chthonobacter rhizosphaerae]
MRHPLRAVLLAIGLVLAAIGPALAVQPGERLQDPALEARARALSAEIRCMVCQNQSIDDSDAQLAKDLRVLVRERLSAGDDDDAVRDFLVARYGEFVLLKPRFEGHTLILWLAAPVLVAVGALASFLAWRRRARVAADGRLSAEEEAALARVLSEDQRGMP